MKKTCKCFDHIDKAERKGRARYVCSNCGRDVSLMWVLYQEAASDIINNDIPFKNNFMV